ncbi:MAG: glycosyltransferase family 2 protein [Candidatus Levybacteria bacterium]|nr:glycosyltransferase family 2 protein [Candidatus Levybacteria bacterium]
MKKSYLVSIIIVNLNGSGLLKECLMSFKNNTYKNTEIIIVDNGSTDGSLEELSKKRYQDLNIRLIRNVKNVGFAEANNQAIPMVNGNLVLLLNNDTIVKPNFLTVLVEKIRSDRLIGVVQPKIIFLDNKRLQSGGAFFTTPGFLYYFGYGQDPEKKIYNKSMPIFSGNGACLLIRREAIKKVSLFDKDFFAYYEETDFCHRVWLSGYKVVYEPASVIYHKGGQTSQKMAESFIFFHSFKNRLASSIKNFELPTLARIVLSLVVIYLFLAIIYSIKFKLRLSIAVINALLWNVVNIDNTLKKRRVIQTKIRAVADKAYLPWISRKFNLKYYLNMFLNKEVLFENEDYPD